MKPEITLIKKNSPNPVMSKHIYLDEQGKVCSDSSQRLMAQGAATRATAETAAELAQHSISENITGFFAILAELSQVEIPTPANDADKPVAPDDKEVAQ